MCDQFLFWKIAPVSDYILGNRLNFNQIDNEKELII